MGGIQYSDTIQGQRQFIACLDHLSTSYILQTNESPGGACVVIFASILHCGNNDAAFDVVLFAS